MKRRIFKTVLPLMAFLLATALAFATDLKSPEGEVPITGYIYENNVCTWVPKDCNNIGLTLCTYNGSQVYRDNYVTSCRTAMTHQPF